MKQKTANYSLLLLLFTVFFGLFQAKKENKNPFKAFNTGYEKRVLSSYDSDFKFNNKLTAPKEYLLSEKSKIKSTGQSK